MASRMDRYKDLDDYRETRTSRNQELYRQIVNYDTAEYSNIEGVAPISKSNEIDLQKLKEMLQKRENETNRTRYKAIDTHRTTLSDLETDNDSYDINSIISKVKSNHKEDNSHRSLKKVDLDFLKSLDLTTNKEKEVDLEPTNIDVLRNMDDNELGLDMLSELKSDETMSRTRTNMDLHKLIEEEVKNSKTDEIEQSFFTTKQSFKVEDFESLDDNYEEREPKKSNLNKIIIILLVIIIIIIFTYFVIKLWI